MHASILGAGLWLAAAGSAGAAPTGCPAPQAGVQERFLSADCADCWAAGGGPAEGAAADAPRGWHFDWIMPGSDGAPLAPAALVEAAERADRTGGPPRSSGERQSRQGAARRAPGFDLRAESGPAWRGYIGVQLRLQRSSGQPWPAGSTAWIALVELLPAGSEGSAVERALVRAVAGPLPLPDRPDARPISHLRALRWPETALPVRLQARAWVEGPDGRMLAVAADRCS